MIAARMLAGLAFVAALTANATAPAKHATAASVPASTKSGGINGTTLRRGSSSIDGRSRKPTGPAINGTTVREKR